MSYFKYLLFLFSIILFSCKKERNYHVHGTLMNEVTGDSHNMGGEKIILYRTGKNFDNTYLETTTDNEGQFDFGITKIKEGTYIIEFSQNSKETYYGLSNSLKQISLSKNTEIDETISIIPTVEAISFIAKPLITSSANDTIFVEFVSEKRHQQDPTILIGSHLTGQELANAPYRTYGGINNTEFMGNIFIKITKSYNGIRTVQLDTIFVKKDEFYRYYSSF